MSRFISAIVTHGLGLPTLQDSVDRIMAAKLCKDGLEHSALYTPRTGFVDTSYHSSQSRVESNVSLENSIIADNPFFVDGHCHTAHACGPIEDANLELFGSILDFNSPADIASLHGLWAPSGYLPKKNGSAVGDMYAMLGSLSEAYFNHEDPNPSFRLYVFETEDQARVIEFGVTEPVKRKLKHIVHDANGNQNYLPLDNFERSTAMKFEEIRRTFLPSLCNLMEACEKPSFDAFAKHAGRTGEFFLVDRGYINIQ